MTAGIEPTGSFFNGKIVAREFQGSLADIRRDSDAQRDMPVIERQHLLRALTATERPIEFAMPRPRMAACQERTQRRTSSVKKSTGRSSSRHCLVHRFAFNRWVMPSRLIPPIFCAQVGFATVACIARTV